MLASGVWQRESVVRVFGVCASYFRFFSITGYYEDSEHGFVCYTGNFNSLSILHMHACSQV